MRHLRKVSKSPAKADFLCDACMFEKKTQGWTECEAAACCHEKEKC